MTIERLSMRSLTPRRVVMIAVALEFLMLIALRRLLVIHHDMGWHLVAGSHILDSGELPRSDPWSFSAGDFWWINLSWAWDVAASLAYRLGGLELLAAGAALLGAVTAGVVASTCLARGAGAVVSVAVVFLMGVAIVGYQLPDVALAVAPQSFTLFLAAVLHRALAQPRFARSRTALAVVPLLMIVWVNVHGGFVVGLTILGGYLLQALFQRARNEIVALARLTGLASAATLLNPYGLHVFEGIARSALAHPGSSISEWGPFPFGAYLPATLYLIAFIAAGDFRDSRIVPADKLIALLWLVLGLSSRRHFAVFLIVSAPFLAASVALLTRRALVAKVEQRFEQFALVPDRGFAALVTCLLGGFVSFGAFRDVEVPRHFYPVEEIRYVAEHHRNAVLFNDWNIGGYIILETEGELKVFIDGRADTAYPPQVTADYFALTRYEGWEEVFDRYGFEVAIIPNYRKSMLFFFDSSPEWTSDLVGTNATVFVRRPPGGDPCGDG